MRLVLEAPRTNWRAGETVTARLVVFNDAYEPIAFDRRLLVGPSFPGLPAAVEPGFAEEHANEVILNPFCLYGRERTLEEASAGEIAVQGFLLARPLQELGPEGLAEEGAIADRAEPLRLTVR
jgi:hypothetical protein